jgi:hypothetical protein
VRLRFLGSSPTVHWHLHLPTYLYLHIASRTVDTFPCPLITSNCHSGQIVIVVSASNFGPHHNSFAASASASASASQAFSSLRHCQISLLYVSTPISWILTDRVRLERILIPYIDCYYSVNISRHLRLVSTFSPLLVLLQRLVPSCAALTGAIHDLPG